MPVCGDCVHLHEIPKQDYHDCRERSPQVVVSGFNSTNPEKSIGKLMTVWPRVAKQETGCGRFKER
jgi:hypothetical protein